MDWIDHDVANGLWFTKDGVGFAIGNEEYAPALYLSRFSKNLVGHYPAIMDWARANSPEFNAEDYLLYWFDELGERFIEHGWHLLWRGKLFSNCEIDQVKEDLARLDNETKDGVSQWPPNTKINIYGSIGGKKIAQLSWASLTGAADLPPLLESEGSSIGLKRSDPESLNSAGSEDQVSMNPPSTIRTYTLHDFTFTVPDGSRDIITTRPLTVTVGTQALEPNVQDGKTLLRFDLWDKSTLLENSPKLRIKINRTQTANGESLPAIVVDDAQSIELLFDNTSFLSQAKEMPAWLVEALEFAAKMLRAQYELNQQHVVLETVD